jgi:hypothetical protein
MQQVAATVVAGAPRLDEHGREECALRYDPEVARRGETETGTAVAPRTIAIVGLTHRVQQQRRVVVAPDLHAFCSIEFQIGSLAQVCATGSLSVDRSAADRRPRRNRDRCPEHHDPDRRVDRTRAAAPRTGAA